MITHTGRPGTAHPVAVGGPSGKEESPQVSSDDNVVASTAQITRLSVNVPMTTMALLRRVAHERGTSITDVVRRAIALLKLIDDAEKDGLEVQVYNPKTDRTRSVQLL